MLGESENAGAMVDELAYSGKTLYGAAVVGFMKKALGFFDKFKVELNSDNTKDGPG